MMKYDYDYIDIDYKSVAEAIAALQAWQSEHPDAVEDSISLPSGGGSIAITFHRPMTQVEIGVYNIQTAKNARYVEERDRLEYEAGQPWLRTYDGKLK